MRHRLNILDIWVDPVTVDQAIKRVSGFLEKDKPHAIFAVNPEKNFSVPKDPELYHIFKNADLLIPDGIGVVLAARFLYSLKFQRIPGVEFMEHICRLAVLKNKSVFIYGAREEVNRIAVEKLQSSYPGLVIAGRSNGYVKNELMHELIQQINDSGAEILFLALGSPRQEKWFATYAPKLANVKVCQGIGGTLDTIAGNVKRAPLLWQNFSAEWLYRLISEPKRISRQRVLPIFAYLVFISKLKSILRQS